MTTIGEAPRPSRPPNKRKALSRRATQNPLPSPPSPDSLNAMIREGDSPRLYVKPIYWTSRHLKLLDFHFVREDLSEEILLAFTHPGFPPTHPLVWYNFIKWSGYFCSDDASSDLIYKSLEQMMFSYGVIPHIAPEKEVVFTYNHKPVARVRADGFFQHSTFGHGRACIAYLDLRRMPHRRERKNCGHLQPQLVEEDPYIAPVMIAMAQGQRHCLRSQNREALAVPESLLESIRDVGRTQPWSLTAPMRTILALNQDPHGEFFQVYLFSITTSTDDPDEKCFYLYKAVVTSEFLDKFDNPSTHVQTDPLVVSYTRLSMASPIILASQLERYLFSELRELDYFGM